MLINPLAGNPLNTRADMAKAFYDLWRPLKPFYSASGTRVSVAAAGARFSGSVAGLEGFARPLWGLAPYIAGGFSFDDIDLYLRGFSAGSDPAHAGYWGDIGDNDQRMVEAGAIGFALCVAPEAFWNPLSEAAKRNLGVWLNGVIEHAVPECNWHFFKVLVAMGLEKVGFAYDRSPVSKSMAAIETYYVEDGWYRDGPQRQMDHYISFAMHFYGLLYAQLSTGTEGKQAAHFRDRAALFAPHYKHWFDDLGSALPFGRSLTYRFAHSAFWAAYAFAGLGEENAAVSIGQAKSLALGNIRWWRDHGDFDRDGVMPVGYAYPNMYLAESYNSPQSAYWAMKAFLPLMFGDDHPFWQAEEVPVEFEKNVVTQSIPGHIIIHEKGQTTALTGGQEMSVNLRMAPEKYQKFAYSTRYGFSLETETRAFGSCVFDNMLGVSLDGFNGLVRTSCLDARIDDDMLYSKWKPCRGVRIETWVFAIPPGHLRIHRIVNRLPIHICEGGFALDSEGCGALIIRLDDDIAQIENDQDISAIRVCGTKDRRVPRAQKCPPNSNLMAARSFVPQLMGQLKIGRHILASHIVASPDKKSTIRALAADIEVPSLRQLKKRRDIAKKVAVWQVPVL